MNNDNRKIEFHRNVVPRIYFSQLRCNLLYWWNKVKNWTRRKENERLPKVNEFIFPSKLLSKCFFCLTKILLRFSYEFLSRLLYLQDWKLSKLKNANSHMWKEGNFGKYLLRKIKWNSAFSSITYYKKIEKAVRLYFKKLAYSILCCFLK
jgi:hypothetical protein